MPKFPHMVPSVVGMGKSVYSNLKKTNASERIPLHIGDTYLEPPVGCRLQDIDVDRHPGMHRYAPVHGLPELRQAVAQRFGERSGLDTDKGQVLIAAGATAALGGVIGALVEPGDEVLIVAPYWPLIGGITTCFHGKPIPVPLVGEVNDAEEAVARLGQYLSDRTVALYVNTPNNPTGTVLPDSWLRALADWAKRNHLWLLADEVYEDYVFEGSHSYTRPLAPDHCISVHSFSKAYGMAGNRVGYIVAPTQVVDQIRKVTTHTFYSTPTGPQWAALRALGEDGDRWVAQAKGAYRDAGYAAADRLGVERPGGSTFLFVDVQDNLGDDGLPGLLRACGERGLWVAPGTSFGPYPGHIRVCFTSATPAKVAKGFDILAEVLGR